MTNSMSRYGVLGLCAVLGAQVAAAQDSAPEAKATLVGFASLPADTFQPGPNAGGNDGTGKPISANGRTGPFAGQPVQGFSGVQFAPGFGNFWFLSDNGFGSQANSADFLLRLHHAEPDFVHGLRLPGKTILLGKGGVKLKGFVQFSDPGHLVPFPLVRENTPERWLTGADFDVESVVVGTRDDFWIGDEFGPFILHFNAKGELLEAPVPTPNLKADRTLDANAFVRAPQNPYLQGAAPNLGSSKGFEGMAYSPDRRTLYPLLEGTVAGDPANALRIYEFDVKSSSFKRFVGWYSAPEGRSIGDFTPINAHEFLVIERDNNQGAVAVVKKIFKIDIASVDANGFVSKEEVVDLLNVRDPLDLNKDGSTVFTFPFQTIEDVLVIDSDTILVANDNNYPFSLGRGPDIDNDEMILLKLNQHLRIDPRLYLHQ
ncbi:MAG: esterase-like activity of phytase family protein [Myxococcales bacterium]